MQRNNLRKIIMITALAAITAGNVNAQTKNEFSVKQAVDYGLKNAVQVKNALLDIQNQEQSNREITSQALPQITASGTYNDYINIPTTLIPGEFFGQPAGTFTPVQFTTKYSSTGGVTLNQTLFDGQVFVGLKARKTAIDFYKKTAAVTEEQIKLNIYKVYYQLIVGQKQLESIQANIDDIGKQLHDTKEMYKNGFSEKLDVDKLTVQLNNIQTQKQTLGNQLEAGNAGLKFLIGMPQKEELILTDTLSEDELKANILDESYNYTDRKDIQLSMLDIKLQGYNVKRYQLSKLPVLSANASYSKAAYGSQFNFINGEWFTTSYVGLNLSVPIFSGFQKNAKIEEAKIALQKSSNNLQLLKNTVDDSVIQARISMKSALATIDNQRQNIQLAEQVYHSTQLKYNQGLGSNQEIYDAQTQLEIAQNSYYSALYDAIIAKVNYLEAVGKL
jgi:outer membrane protein